MKTQNIGNGFISYIIVLHWGLAREAIIFLYHIYVIVSNI